MKNITLFVDALVVLCGLFLLQFFTSHTAVYSINPILTQEFSATLVSSPSKEIVISLGQQQLTAYDGSTVFLQTPVTTGGPDLPTPAGTYHVLAKPQNFVMHSPWPPSDPQWYPNSFVKYGLLFRTGGYYIHDASWRTNFGPGSNTVVGTPGGNTTGTHGCVNVPPDAEAKLYDWAQVGTEVIVTQ